jgi:NhaP-type Na+/H+ or K+/H+ antiporter
MIEITSIALVFLIFSLVSRKLANTVITAPLFFLVAGILLASELLKAVSFENIAPWLLYVGVSALGLSFFNDASRINLTALRGNISLPARMLLVALPLTVLAGTLLAGWLFPDLRWLEAALLAAILTPADTGLISLVLSSSRVPIRIRQALNIESSLNDGVTTPIVALLIALSQVRLGQESAGFHLFLPLQQIVVAGLVGIFIGGLGGWVFQKADQQQWIIPSFQGLVFPCLTMLALTVAALLGGNYFIACFIAGIVLALFLQEFNLQKLGFSETLTQILSLIVFFYLGAKVIDIYFQITWQTVIYAVLSLTVVRIIPMVIAVLGKGLQWESRFFLGWFGPRGLASIVLGSLVVAQLPSIPHREIIVTTVALTVALSVIVHGMSEIPIVIWYGRRMLTLHSDSPEMRPVDETPMRLGWTNLTAQYDQRISSWEKKIEHGVRTRQKSDDQPGEE